MNVKKIIFKWIPFVAIFLMVSGCYTDDNYFMVTQKAGDIDLFFDKVQTKEQTVTVNANDGIRIITELETIIDIPGAAFEDASGNIVSNTDILFTYVELKDKGSIVLYNKPTVTSDQIIETGGVFYFSVTDLSGENELRLANGKSINVRTEADNPVDDMELFWGVVDSENFFWLEADNNPNTWNNVMASEWELLDSNIVTEGLGYEFLSDRLAWINCDRFLDIPADQLTSVCVALPDNYTNQNTIMFAIFKDINSVVGLFGDADKKMFCESYEAMPIGYDVDFISITAFLDGTYHYASRSTTITANHEDSMVPEEKTLQEILDLLGQY